MNDEDLIEAVHREMTLQGFPAWGYHVAVERIDALDVTALRVEGMIHRGDYRGWQKFGTQQYIQNMGMFDEVRRKVAQDVAARFARDFREAAA